MVQIKEEVLSDEEIVRDDTSTEEHDSDTEGDLDDDVKVEINSDEENGELSYEEIRKRNIQRNKEKMKEILGEKKKSKKKNQVERKSRRIAGETLTDDDEDDDQAQDTVTFERRPFRKGTPRGPITAGPNVMRKMHGKIYDSMNGKTCHQCRQKTIDVKTECSKCHSLKGALCYICLKNRYGEELETVLEDDTWVCPYCRKLCNCSFCMDQPTGQLIQIARSNGYSSVCHMMLVNGLYNCKDIRSRPIKNISSETKNKIASYIPPKIKLEIKSEDEEETPKKSRKKVKSEKVSDEEVEQPKKKKKKEKVKKEETEESDDEVYVVEAIIDHRVNKKKKETEYLIKWEGWTEEWNEWIPESQCSCDTLIKKYCMFFHF